MATVTVVAGPLARDQHVVRVTPGTAMRDVLDDVCRKLKRDPRTAALSYGSRRAGAPSRSDAHTAKGADLWAPRGTRAGIRSGPST